MKPMHAKIKHTSRCPCCRSNFSTGGATAKQQAKSAARQDGKRKLAKEVRDL